jgi:hypothetical protein
MFVDKFQDNCFATDASTSDMIPINFHIESGEQVKATYSINGRNITGDLFALDNVYFDVTDCSEKSTFITMNAPAGLLKTLSDKMRPTGRRSNYCHVSPTYDKEQGLDVLISIQSTSHLYKCLQDDHH